MSTMAPERWRQVKALVAEAMDAPLAERDAFIGRVCGCDTALRREVESLLAAVERSGGFPSGDPPGPDRGGGEERHDAALRAALDAALGERYGIVRSLGRGGMGAVYLVRDRRHDRPLALKVLLPQATAALGDTAGAERFLREIRIAARLSHPHILALHDSGNAGGLLYYTMPYVPGESLRERLRREGQLPLGEALAIAGQVAAALDYAHRQGVVHRDVKPENILVHDGQAFVADFGVARAVNASAGDRLTATGLAVGTPVYMSPEQAAGEREVDGRSDVYALGAVLYEMLAGEPPFTGGSANSILARKLTQEVPSLCALREGVPPAVDAAVRRALRRARADRFASAGAFALALERAAGDATDARPVVRSPLAGAVRAHRRALAAAGSAVAALGAIALGVTLAAGRGSARRDSGAPDVHALAVMPIETDSSSVWLADDVRTRLAAELAGVRALGVTGERSSRRYRGTAKPPATIAKELDVDALVTGAMTRTGDSLYLHVRLLGARAGEQLWASEFAEDAHHLDHLQKEVAREVVDFLRLPVTAEERRRLARARVVDPRANEAYQRGLRMSAAFDPDRFRKAIAAFEEAVRLDPEFAAPYVALGETYQGMAIHDTLPAAEAFGIAKGYVRQALRLDADNAEAHVVLAGIHHMWDWDWAGAEREFTLAIRSNPGSARAHWQYGAYLRTMSRCDSAVAELQRARRIDPLSTISLGDLSFAYICAGRPDSAMFWARQALDLDPNSPPLHLALGWAFAARGQHDSSITALRRAAALNPLFRLALAQGYVRAGRVADADRILATMSDREKRRHAGPLALLYATRGDREATFRYLDVAYREHNSWLGEIANRPELARFAADPRYHAFRRRLGLPPLTATAPARGVASDRR